MRVCPKCGHQDAPVWRFAKFKRFTHYCRADELEVWDPKLVSEIPLNGQVVEINDYRYKRKKSGYIERIHKIDCAYPVLLKMDEPEMESGSEKVRRKLVSWSNKQTKLLEVLKWK